MKIIISPSKTKKINNLPVELKNISIQENDFYTEILYPKITNKIIERIKMFSVEEIEKKFK